METMATVPLVDYVTADKRGAVAEKDKAPEQALEQVPRAEARPLRRLARSRRRRRLPGRVREHAGQQARARRQTAGSGSTRSTTSRRSGRARTRASTPTRPTYAEMVTRTEATASGLLKVDPSAFVLGAVMFGWSRVHVAVGRARRQGEQRQVRHLPRLLPGVDEEARSRSTTSGWSTRSTSTGTRRRAAPSGSPRRTSSPKTVAARAAGAAQPVGSDATSRRAGSPAELGASRSASSPGCRRRIAARYPGTKLAMTEYNFGAGDHISGGLAQADVLGIFGREGLYLANYWGDGAGNGHLPKLHQGGFQALPELRRQGGRLRRHRRRRRARRSRQGVDLRRHRLEAPGDADRPRDQQGAAHDLQRRRSPSRGAPTPRRRCLVSTPALPRSVRCPTPTSKTISSPIVCRRCPRPCSSAPADSHADAATVPTAAAFAYGIPPSGPPPGGAPPSGGSSSR